MLFHSAPANRVGDSSRGVASTSHRLLDAGVTPGEGLLVLGGYSVIYCLPCLALLLVGVLARRRTHELLSRITRRFGTGVVNASPMTATALMLLGGYVASLPFWALR